MRCVTVIPLTETSQSGATDESPPHIQRHSVEQRTHAVIECRNRLFHDLTLTVVLLCVLVRNQVIELFGTAPRRPLNQLTAFRKLVRSERSAHQLTSIHRPMSRPLIILQSLPCHPEIHPLRAS